MAVRPAVIGAVLERVKCLVGLLQAEMVRTLIRRQEKIADPFQADRVAQARGQIRCWSVPSGFISMMLARTFSFSTHALQLDPTETYSLPFGENAIVRVRCQPPYL